MLALLSHTLVVVLLALLLPFWRGVALAWLSVLLGVLQWRYRFSNSGSEIIGAIRLDAGGWSVRHGLDANAAWQPVHLLSPVFCHRHLLVLRLRRKDRWLPQAVAVTHDSCSADEFRRIRVLARHLPAPRLWAASR